MFSLKVDNEIELGLLELRHAQLLVDLNDQSRAHLQEWLPIIGNLTTLEDFHNFIKAGLKRFAENNGWMAGIWYQGKLAGCINYRFFDWHVKQTELGYWLGQPFTGKGIMTRTVRKMTDYAFTELGMNRVEIRCAPGNTASRAVPERLGFTQEGILRQTFWKYDHWLDTVVYSMLAAEWEQKQ